MHARSNHPPLIIKNLPTAINKRLSEISSSEDIFNQAKPPYQEALRKSGYQHELKYEKHKKPCRNRTRNIMWYKPPYSSNVKSNIGKSFIKIVKETFQPQHKLYKIFNSNTLKLSYSCMPNMKNIIDGHNKRTIERSKKKEGHDNPTKTCNCRNQNECPAEGQCLRKSVIYQATVTTDGNSPKETYIGLTKNTFKERFTGHKTTFKNTNKRNSTELSKHIWNLKDKQKEHEVTWKIIREAKPYSNKTKRCQLCNSEKIYIIYKPELGTLNNRNELASACRHKAGFLLKNFKQ